MTLTHKSNPVCDSLLTCVPISLNDHHPSITTRFINQARRRNKTGARDEAHETREMGHFTCTISSLSSPTDRSLAHMRGSSTLSYSSAISFACSYVYMQDKWFKFTFHTLDSDIVTLAPSSYYGS